MGDHFRQNLQNLKDRLKKLPKKEKKNIILAIGVSIFIMGVFFLPSPGEISEAKNKTTNASISLEELTPKKKLGTFIYKDPKERKKQAIKASLNLPKELKNSNPDENKIAALAVGRPMERMMPEKKLGNFIYKNPKENKKPAGQADKSCATDEIVKEEITGARLGEKEVVMMVAGHPIEEMAPYISKRDKKVASFLVAIAKKESDWGVYSPKKSGRECYNYWGYKGAHDLTEAGYSCFDSPEQAVKEVGDRIENLLGKNINTAERMVVWKCGRSCAGHDPAGVRKWISDVALYYGKLNS